MWLLHLGDAMALVMKEMDLQTAMNARAVCKSWRRYIKQADLEPLEAGCSEQEKAQGRECQRLLQEARALENQVWSPEHTAKLAKHLTNQNEITAEMRHKLVNWLIEVHFKFEASESCLHLTIQLLDHFLADKVVKIEKFQTVGVTAFKLGCKYKGNGYFNLHDLPYYDYSSLSQDISNMEKDICKQLEKNMKDPNPADYLKRFSKAAKLESTECTNGQYTKSYSMTLYFIDMAFLDGTLVHTRPSLIAAAAIMCTLRVLGRRDWSAQLEYYTTYRRETVAALAEKLIANGRACTASAISHKYTSQRLGGVGDQVGADGKTLNDGCLHILAGYFKQLL